MITVVLVCWKRFEHFEDIIKYWLRQPKVNQVIVMDNSGEFKTDLPVLLFNVNRNLGGLIRFAAGQFAKNDIIIFCDDDANHVDGVVEDFLKYFSEDKILGIVGLHYTGEVFKQSPKISGRAIKEPVKVDYIPANTCMTHRKHCILDIGTYPWGDNETVWGGEEFYGKVAPVWLEDFWWRLAVNKEFPNVERWVIPTKKIRWYPESGDKWAIHKNPRVFELLEKIYQQERSGEKIL